jgi:hypothetical protein
LIFFTTGIFASAASYAFGPYYAVGVGASGAIFGVFGVAFAVRYRFEAMQKAFLVTLDELCAQDFPDCPLVAKLRFFERTGQSFGRSALMLSGGATLGLFHSGVIKALWMEGLLPRVISGSSAGSIAAATIGTHTDAELARVFNPDGFTAEAWRSLGFKSLLKGSTLMDSSQLELCIEQNVDALTFGEAFDRTGRIINIPVSPTRAHQHSRLLNYLTAPNVMVRRAALASSAIPGVFPAVMLEAKDFNGIVVPYMIPLVLLLVALEQADGRRDLELSVNTGDDRDFPRTAAGAAQRR